MKTATAPTPPLASVWSSEKVSRVSTSLGLGDIEIAGIAGDQQAAPHDRQF
jgi:glycerol kinase